MAHRPSPSTPPPPSPPDDVAAPTKGELTKQAVLDAAVARFGSDGYRGTSVADVARAASVGGTVAYAYFANKEDLFLSALDQDASAAIAECLPIVFAGTEGRSSWRLGLLAALVERVQHHPLARRVLAGLEPDVTARVIDIPAIKDLRSAVADRLAADQRTGHVRADIDPVKVGNGAVTIFLSLLMSILQLGEDALSTSAADVIAVFEAAIDPIAPVDPI
jgi:AcrR family transcriptional regulator